MTNTNYCRHCGTQVEGKFCINCGHELLQIIDDKHELSWQANIPLNNIFAKAVKVFWMAGLIMFLLVEAMMLMLYKGKGSLLGAILNWRYSDGDMGLIYAAGMIGIMIILSVLLICWLMHGGYEAEYNINKEGLSFTTRQKQRRKNKIVNGLLLILSIFGRRPGGVGTALIAEHSQSGGCEWTDVKSYTVNERSGQIAFRDSWHVLFELYCPLSLLPRIEELILRYSGLLGRTRTIIGWRDTSLAQTIQILVMSLLLINSPLLAFKQIVYLVCLWTLLTVLGRGRLNAWMAKLGIAAGVALFLGQILNAFTVTMAADGAKQFLFSTMHSEHIIGALLGMLASVGLVYIHQNRRS